MSGWFAPLALVWVAAAVFLQRVQLRKQQEELEQNTAALELQAEELRRTVEQLERHTVYPQRESERRDHALAAALTERQYDRLAMTIERLARLGEGIELRRPLGDDESFLEGTIFGKSAEYLEWSRRQEIGRSVEVFGARLRLLADRVREGWILDADLRTLDELLTELRFVEQVSKAAEEAQRSGEVESARMGYPSEQVSGKFRTYARHAGQELDRLKVCLQELDSPDDP